MVNTSEVIIKPKQVKSEQQRKDVRPREILQIQMSLSRRGGLLVLRQLEEAKGKTQEKKEVEDFANDSCLLRPRLEASSAEGTEPGRQPRSATAHMHSLCELKIVVFFPRLFDSTHQKIYFVKIFPGMYLRNDNKYKRSTDCQSHR